MDCSQYAAWKIPCPNAYSIQTTGFTPEKSAPKGRFPVGKIAAAGVAKCGKMPENGLPRPRRANRRGNAFGRGFGFFWFRIAESRIFLGSPETPAIEPFLPHTKTP
jgi:hypothetical protein